MNEKVIERLKNIRKRYEEELRKSLKEDLHNNILHEEIRIIIKSLVSLYLQIQLAQSNVQDFLNIVEKPQTHWKKIENMIRKKFHISDSIPLIYK